MIAAVSSTVLIAALVCSLFVGGMLVADARGRSRAVSVLKAAASTAFLATAIAAGALDGEGYGIAIFVALCLSWLGDVLLLGRDGAWFLGGLGAFLVAHVAYGVAFWRQGISLPWTLSAALALGALAFLIDRWLWPKVPADMRVPVRAYIVVITFMVALAAGATGAGAHPSVLIGAVLFFVSDLSVALDHFVEPGPRHRRWGWPAYFAAQLCLAGSIALM